MSNKTTEILIIGAGPGGYSAAFLAADKGSHVTLIDKNPTIGGVCLHEGCIPSKALLHAAKILNETKKAQEIGLSFQDININTEKLNQWKYNIIEKLTNGLNHLAKRRNIEFICGEASFLNSNTVKIKKSNNEIEEISFQKAIVATGTKPITLPNIPLTSNIITSTEALTLENIPKSLLIVGGGYIGLELGSIYAGLGAEVSIIEKMPELLTGSDRDLIRTLMQNLKKIFSEILLSTALLDVKESPSGLLVTLEDKNKKIITKEYEKILICIGRKPDTKNIGIEKTKIQLDDKGFIKVSPNRQTDDPPIYAIGDITGNPFLAHKASTEGKMAVETILEGKSAYHLKNIPSVIFTEPEVAVCGLTERTAKEKNINIEVVKFPWIASGKALTLNSPEGFTKLIIDPQTKKILGISIVGTGAGDLISEGALAIEKGLTADDLKNCIHPHPSLSETIMESAEIFFGTCTSIYKPKKNKGAF